MRTRADLDIDTLIARVFTPDVDPRGIDGGEPAIPEHTPEQRLLFAVLLDGLRRAAHGKTEARMWAFSRRRGYGTLLDLCEIFSLDPGTLRAALVTGELGKDFSFIEDRVEHVGVRAKRGRHREAA